MSEAFIKQFGTGNGSIKERKFQAPARINIIGEHVDYLGGIVLPAAIDFHINATIRPNGTSGYRLYSEDFMSFWETNEITKSDKAPWANYILGVIDQFMERGFEVPGFDLSLEGNIPQGAGLSSSAAVEVSVGYAINEVFQFGLDRTEIALIGQAAENHFVGTNCGIMDQFIIAWGKEKHCISLDTSSLKFEYHHFDLGNHEFYLIQSNVKHSLKDSAYNDRRADCESALRKIQKIYPGLLNLYSLEPSTDLTNLGLSDNELKRVRHVITEKGRTERVIAGLRDGKYIDVGETLYECHDSLSKYFEVSCLETDFLVETLRKEKILGARMIGGGFGGCILVIDQMGRMEDTRVKIEQAYKMEFGMRADFYQFKISDGVREII